MHWNDVLDDMISGLQPEYVPVEYIVCAKLVDWQGVQRIVRGAELAQFMANPDHAGIQEARVVLDVRKIRRAMIASIMAFFEALEQRLADSK